MNAEKVLVMGASGFLGSHVVKALGEQGCDIRIFTRPSSDVRAIQHLEYEHVYGDVSDKASIKHAVEGCSVVYYCIVDTRAWLKEPKQLRETNIEGLKNVLAVVETANLKKFIYTSSFMTIGLNPSGIASEADTFNWHDQATEYVRLRVEAENLVLNACNTGLPGVVCCVSMTFGVDDIQPTPHGWLIGLMATGRLPCYWDASFSSVDIRDAADAMLLAESKGKIGERYIITEKTLSIKAITTTLTKHLNLPFRFYSMPMWLMTASCWLMEMYSWLRGKETRLTVASLRMTRQVKDFDNSKAINELGWRPRPAEEAIAEAATWLVEHKGDTGELSLKSI